MAIDLRDQNREHAENQYKEQLRARQEQITHIASSVGPISPRFRKLAADFQYAKDELQTCKNRLGGRSPQIYLETKWVFLVAIAIVLITEAFVNKVLFDMALLSNSVISVLASALISGFLVFFAHISGFQLRQVWSDFHNKIAWDRVVLGLICAFIVLFAVLGIMYTRAFFDAVNLISGDISVFGKVVTQIFSDGFSKFLTKAFSTSESTVMGAVNFSALFGAFLVAAFSHDSDYEYDRRYRVFKKLDNKIEKINAEFTKSIGKTQKRFEQRLANAKQLFTDSGGNPEQLPKNDIRQCIQEAISGETNVDSSQSASAVQQGILNNPESEKRTSWHDE